MNDDAKIISSDDGVVCPECGEDVCSVGRIELRWPDMSLVIPRVLWILVLGVFLAACTPWVGSMLGNQLALYNSVQKSENYWVRLHEPLISGKTVQDASAADDGARGLVQEQFKAIDEETQLMGAREKIRFDFVDPAGTLYAGEHWGLGGNWLARSSNLALRDLRDGSNIEDGYFGKPYDSWSWFSFSRSQTGGGQANGFSVGLGSILSILATCLVVVYLVRRAGRKLGVAVVEKRHCRVILFLLLLIGSTLFAINHHSATRGLHSRGKLGGSTAWYHADELHEAIQDAEKMDLLIESIIQAIPEGDPDDWLLGETRGRGYNTRFARFELAFGTLLSIASGSYTDFFIEHPDGTTTRINKPDGYESGFRMYTGLQFLGVSWTGQKSMIGLSISPTQILLGIVIFYWFWKLIHAMSRIVFYRFERRRTRRRVRRDQCIFCAYPLSEEARIARSLDIGS